MPLMSWRLFAGRFYSWSYQILLKSLLRKRGPPEPWKSCSPHAYAELDPNSARGGVWQARRCAIISPLKKRLAIQLQEVCMVDSLQLLASKGPP